MIKELNWADIINYKNETNKTLAEREDKLSCTVNIENAFHTIIMKKINEIIKEVNRTFIIKNITAGAEIFEDLTKRGFVDPKASLCTCQTSSAEYCPVHPRVAKI